jgi:iron complex transport system ATP-binding protein
MRLEAAGVRFAYRKGEDVLRGVSFAVEEGEVLFVLGPNGCGKTTLLECLAGIRRPTAGAVLLDGADVHVLAARERARRIGLVPQLHEPAFPYTVLEMVLLGRAPCLRTLARPGPEDRREAERALEAVGIAPLSDRSFTTLSGGERQLALVARGLAQGARVLLLDEPDAHLDPFYQGRVLGVARELSRAGASVVLSTHDPTSALSHADRVLFLVRGTASPVAAPVEAITGATLEAAYGVPFSVLQGEDGERAVALRPRSRGTPLAPGA